MAGVALGLYVLYGLTAFGLRSWQQWRRTGSTGFRGLDGRPGSAPWWAGVLFLLAIVVGVTAPVLQLAGVVAPLDLLDSTLVQVIGLVLALGGIVSTLAAQQSMGDSWRVGVDPGETTALVTSGVFALVRNPIFTAMIVTGAGLALLAPNVIAVAGFVVLVIGIELQVRVVEEPYLRRVHGDEYADYTARTGRFLPKLRRVDHVA